VRTCCNSPVAVAEAVLPGIVARLGGRHAADVDEDEMLVIFRCALNDAVQRGAMRVVGFHDDEEPRSPIVALVD
jgi:hypothetical protein